MKPMRLLLVYPGALHSTIDVARGYHDAFKQIESVQLFTFQYHKYLAYHSAAQRAIDEAHYQENLVIQEASKNLLVRILECRPDVIMFISGVAFPAYLWNAVHQLQGDLKHSFTTAVLFTESPYIEEWERGILERVNFAFMTEYGTLEKYKADNPNTFYIGHAYNPSVHYPSALDYTARDIDVFFVGTGFPERQAILDSLNLANIKTEIHGNFMYLTPTSPIAPLVHNSNLENAAVAEYYRRSRIALNIFRSVKWPTANPEFIQPDIAKSVSPRCYEAMRCGSLLLTDWREELGQFAPDSYVVWGATEELDEKLRYLVQHPTEAARIAANGAKAVADFTFLRRANQILSLME